MASLPQSVTGALLRLPPQPVNRYLWRGVQVHFRMQPSAPRAGGTLGLRLFFSAARATSSRGETRGR